MACELPDDSRIKDEKTAVKSFPLVILEYELLGWAGLRETDK